MKINQVLYYLPSFTNTNSFMVKYILNKSESHEIWFLLCYLVLFCLPFKMEIRDRIEDNSSVYVIYYTFLHKLSTEYFQEILGNKLAEATP